MTLLLLATAEVQYQVWSLINLSCVVSFLIDGFIEQRKLHKKLGVSFNEGSLTFEIENLKEQKVALVTIPEEDDDVERLISLVEVVMVCSPVLLPNLLAPDRAGELLKSEEIEEVTPSLLPSTPDLCCLQKKGVIIIFSTSLLQTGV